MTYAQIVPFAASHLGLVTWVHLRAVTSRRVVDGLVASRQLIPIRRGVFRVGGSPPSWEQAVLAACLAREGAVASFSTAAVLWGFPGFERDDIELTVEGERRARLEGVTVHTTTVLGSMHRAGRGPIPVTSAARTLCDLSSRLGPARLGFAVDEALRRKLMTLRQFTAVASELDGQGRKRCTITRKVLEERSTGYEPGDSHPERRIAKLLVGVGLPTPKLGHQVRVNGRMFRLDLGYPAIRFALEYDSQPFHDRTTAFFGDRERDVLLDEAGWAIKRVTAKTTDEQIVGMVQRAHERADADLHPANSRQSRTK
jgi:hypothetical protein